MKKKKRGRILLLGGILGFILALCIAATIFTNRNGNSANEILRQESTESAEEETEQEMTEQETTESAEQDKETNNPEMDSQSQASQNPNEQEETSQESPFDMSNPVPDETYTGIVAYEAKEVLEANEGLSKAEVTITMPQLTMRSATAGMINEKLLEFYTKEYETGLSRAKEDMQYQEEVFEGGEGPITYQYAYDTGYEVTFMNEKYLSILAVGYEYAGGAHGMPYRTALIFNLETGEQVMGESLFALSDAQVQAIKIEAYKELFEQAEEGAYWEEALSIVETATGEEGGYYLTEEGVTFYYHPYTLAPYAAGFVEVTVPYETLPLK